jgi:prefoldin subunit 5
MAEPVSLGALSPAELAEVRQSLEQELRTMTQNAVTLQSTAAKFGAAGQAVEYLQDQKQGERGLPAPALPALCTCGLCVR